MNTTKIKLTIIGICGLILVPLSSHASSATLVTDNSVLFTIDFSFNDDKFDVEVPIVAEFGINYLDRVDTVGYTVESEGDEAEVTDVVGVVLSRSAIEGSRYAVPTGTEADFTLIVLATFEEAVTNDLSAHITKLPYWLDERRTTVHQNQLDDLDRPILETTE